MSNQDNKINVVNVRLVDAPALYSDREISSVEDALMLIADELKQYDREVFGIINLKSNGQIVNFNICSMGTVNMAIVSPREVFKSTILSNAQAFIGIHNHPSGNYKPSENDIMTTKQLMQCGRIMDIKMIDHVIVGGATKKIFSFNNAGMMNDNGLNKALMEMKIKEPINEYMAKDNQEKDTFSIYQLKHGDNTRDFKFESYSYMMSKGYAVDITNYDRVYTAELKAGTSLEDIYRWFNIDRPYDFRGHSLSVSDVVVLHQNGKDTAHYVDSIGYKEIPDFLPQEKQLTSSQDIKVNFADLLEDCSTSELSGFDNYAFDDNIDDYEEETEL